MQEMLQNAVNGVVTHLTAVVLNDEQHIESLVQLTLIKITYNL